MNFSVIYNPIATKFSQPVLDHLVFKFIEKGYTLHKIKKSEYAGHVIPLIKELDPESDLLITLGGDGTVNEAVRAFHEIDQHCLYAHISAGTTNDIANNYNLYRKDPIKSIDKLAEEGVESMVDSILVNGEPVSYVSSFGYVAPIPYLVNTKLKKLLGHAAYVVSALPILARKPERIKIEYTANGVTRQTTVILALITTSKGMGGINLYRNIDLNDGKFDVFFLEKLSPRLIADIFPKYLTDTIDMTKYEKYSTHFTTDHMTIRFPGLLPKHDLDNDGNQATFSLNLHDNVLDFRMGKKIRVLKPER